MATQIHETRATHGVDIAGQPLERLSNAAPSTPGRVSSIDQVAATLVGLGAPEEG